MTSPAVTVAIPTLRADRKLGECLDALERQTLRDLEILVVDNSGNGLARDCGEGRPRVRVIDAGRNTGFGGAVNRAIRESQSAFVAALNDDAVAHEEWLSALMAAAEARPDAGMFASQVRFYGEDQLDSAGMVIARDGSSKQRGHLFPSAEFANEGEVLLPSASAALYRRAMLEEIGLFDEDFFLYCEDTDLGLRAQWAGWKCVYVPQAVVEHHYSHSAGRASRLKAYYVERNRLFVIAKNFPARALWAAPFSSVARYWWHLRSMALGRGTAAQFRREGSGGLRLVWIVLRAHWGLIRAARSLLEKRRAIRRRAKIPSAEFSRLLRTHSIPAKRVAEL